uniref:Ig-like domain-containing protein n=1 Tax=Strigops habroptila TaxID=2489341 RepID=A0A672U463_STRHB
MVPLPPHRSPPRRPGPPTPHRTHSGRGGPDPPPVPGYGWRTPPVPDGPQGVELVPEPGPRVQEGTNVTLRCRGAARPPPRLYQWVRDGASLGWSRKGLWVVPSAPPEASGRYRCRATNEVGDGESDDVMVKVYCEWPLGGQWGGLGPMGGQWGAPAP